ncbi:TonB-dependent hemoglobin/transferrin/lactoferrin family receptor [Candidatus Sororendozoicomonas aggregata]|uniref:TonB-dependent hemoglobin/transferrin/lactoferrin family receptor n=1 Tax=Candidatus Sororendozoicomonas aggregata TaxID=3073239 RepID=UPI002ED351FC
MNLAKTKFAIAILAATASVARADETDAVSEKSTTLEQVTVSATRTEKQLKDVAASVTVINKAQMEKKLATNIKDMVRYEPGVSVQNGSRGGLKGFNIRGMEGNRVKIIVDGVDQAQYFNAGGDYIRNQRSFVDIDSIKAVEIVKGPASSLYGSDAIGGMVAFQTKDPADYLKTTGDETAASVKGEYKSADQGFSETFSLANRSGDLETMLVYTRRDHHETKNHGEGADTFGEASGLPNPADTGLNNILAKAQYQISDAHRVGLTGELFDATSTVKLKSLEAEGARGKDQMTRGRIGFFHQWQANIGLFDKARWQVDWQKSRSHMKTHMPAYVFGPMSFPERLLDYNYSENAYSLGAQFDKTITFAGLRHNIVYGLNASQTRVKNNSTEYDLDAGTTEPKNYIPTTDVTKYGVYLQDDLQVTDRLVVTPALRYDTFKYRPEGKLNNGETVSDSSGDKLTARLGSVYKFSERLSGFAQFSQGFKAPGYLDMYYTYNGGATVLANPDLKPEESNSFELGLRGDGNLGSYEVTGFYNKYTNFIEQVVIGHSAGKEILQSQNIGKVNIKGIELRGQLWLDEAVNAPTGTTLRGSLAYADGENKDNGEKLNSVAPLTAVIGLGFDDPSGKYGGELAWTLVKGKSSKDVSNSDLLEGGQQFNPGGYGLIDLTTYYNPAENVTLRAGIFNLTDKKYWVLDDVRGRDTTFAGIDRYTQPGRNVSVSVKWDI